MIGGQRVLGLIPARGGSKGLPGKHLRALGDRPLIAWTICAALQSRYLDRVVVSSDDPQIRMEAERWGADVPFERPAELGTDEASSIDVALHALHELPGFDLLVLLQATSPLRTASDIDGALEQLDASRAPSCASVTEPDKSPFWHYSISAEGVLKPLLQPGAVTRRQDLPRTVVLNGAIYVATVDSLLGGRRLVDAETVAYLMPKERSVDIDTALDLEIAALLARNECGWP